MKISCQSCAAKYTIADDKVRGKTVKIKCKKCGAAIVVGPETPADDGAQAAGAAGGEWMLNVADGDQRTLPVSQIAELFQQGVISDATYVWREGMSDWEPLGQMTELKAAVSAALSLSAPAPAASYDDIDEGMPTQMAQSPLETSAPPWAGASAARRADAPAGGDLFAPKAPMFDDDEATRVGDLPGAIGGAAAPQQAAPQQAARRAPSPVAAPIVSAPASYVEPPMAGSAEGSEASGLIDIRKLQSALKKTESPKKAEQIDDIMNLGGGSPLFASPPPMLLSPPSFDQPPPPEPARVAAAPAMHGGAPYPPPAEQPKSKTGLIVGALVALLALGGIGAGVVVSMNNKSAEQLAEAQREVAAAHEKAAAAEKDKAAAEKDSIAATEKAAAAEKAAAEKAAAAETDKKDDDDKKAEADSAAAAEKEYANLSPEEKKKREEAYKKRKEEQDAKKKADEEKKKADEEKKKKAAEAAAKPAEAAPAAPAAGGGGDKPFDRAAAISALNGAAGAASSCKKPDGPTGSGRISVTFAPSGAVTSANIEGAPFAGTPVGGCIATKFRGARVPAFSGSAVTVKKSFSIN